MRYRPLAACAFVALAACTPAPAPQPGPLSPVAQPSATAAPAASPEVSPSPSMDVSPAPVPSLSPLVAASVSPSPSPSPTPSGSPVPLGSPSPLGEANHGTQPFPDAPGVSSDALAIASATATAGDATAFGAIDGRVYTEWAARQGATDNLALTLDLGAPVTFSKVDVLPDASPTVNCFFNVDTSPDGKVWNTVASGHGVGSNTTPAWGTATFEAQTARYVRIKPTSWGTSWVAIWEVRVRK